MADNKKRTAREIAEEMDYEQSQPVLKKYTDTAGGAVDKITPGVGKNLATGAAMAGMVPAMMANTIHHKVTGRKFRTDEDLNELTREVSKGGQKKAKGGKVKKYADGGMTQQPTYPFYGNQPQAGGQNGGTNQTFNMQPQANAGAPNPQQPMQQPMQTFKKGGKVSSASKRADGCAIRGKTRA